MTCTSRLGFLIPGAQGGGAPEWREPHASMHEPRLCVDADVQLHPKVILVPLLHLPHLRVALS